MAAQKPLHQHLARETSLLGVTRSPTSVARAPVTSREMATIGWGFGETSTLGIRRGQGQSQPRPSPRWGNGRSRAQ